MTIRHRNDVFGDNLSAQSGTLSDVIDFGGGGDISFGNSIYLIVQVTKDITSAGTVNAEIRHSDSETTGFTNVKNAWLILPRNSKKGTRLWKMLPVGATKRYLRAHIVSAATAGEVSVFLSPMQPGSRSDFKHVR